jgi:hypothetical protein
LTQQYSLPLRADLFRDSFFERAPGSKASPRKLGTKFVREILNYEWVGND